MENSVRDSGELDSDTSILQDEPSPSKREDDTEYFADDYSTEPVLLKQMLSFSNAIHQFDFVHGFHREERRDGFSFYVTSLYLNILWMSVYFIGSKLQGACSWSWFAINSPFILILVIFDIVLYIYSFRSAWVIKLKSKNRSTSSLLFNPLRAAQSVIEVKLMARDLLRTILRITVQFLCFTTCLDFPKYRLLTLMPFMLVNFLCSFQSQVSKRQSLLKQFIKKNYNAFLRSFVFASIVVTNFSFLGSLPLYYYWFRRFAKFFKDKFRQRNDVEDEVEDDELDQMEYGNGVVNFCFFIIMFGIHAKHFTDFMGFPILSCHMAFIPVHFIMAVINTGFTGLLD